MTLALKAMATCGTLSERGIKRLCNSILHESDPSRICSLRDPRLPRARKQSSQEAREERERERERETEEESLSMSGTY